MFEPRGGQNNADAFVLTGDGAPQAKEVFSPAIHVAAGKTYAFSARVDASKVTSDPTYLWVSNASRNRMFFKAKILPRQAGRFEFSARIPNDVHEVTFGYYTNGCRLAKGDKIVFAAPVVSGISK